MNGDEDVLLVLLLLLLLLGEMTMCGRFDVVLLWLWLIGRDERLLVFFFFCCGLALLVVDFAVHRVFD